MRDMAPYSLKTITTVLVSVNLRGSSRAAWHVTTVTLRVNPQGRRRRCTNVNSNNHPGDWPRAQVPWQPAAFRGLPPALHDPSGCHMDASAARRYVPTDIAHWSKNPM